MEVQFEWVAFIPERTSQVTFMDHSFFLQHPSADLQQIYVNFFFALYVKWRYLWTIMKNTGKPGKNSLRMSRNEKVFF